MDDGARRACPSRKGGNVIAERGIVNLVDENTEESGGFVVRVRLELRVEVDDECGGDRGEQTSL